MKTQTVLDAFVIAGFKEHPSSHDDSLNVTVFLLSGKDIFWFYRDGNVRTTDYIALQNIYRKQSLHNITSLYCRNNWRQC